MKLRLLLISILFIAFTGCERNNDATFLHNGISNKTAVDTISLGIEGPATEDDYLSAREHYADPVLCDIDDFEKVEGVVSLPLQNNDMHYILRDTMPLADTLPFASHRYIGQYKTLGLYITTSVNNVRYSCTLVDKDSGTETVLWHIPHLSPGGKYLADIPYELFTSGDPSGYQIWRLDKKCKKIAVIKIKEVHHQDWVPYDLVWENQNTFIIRAITMENHGISCGGEFDNGYIYIRVKIAG